MVRIFWCDIVSEAQGDINMYVYEAKWKRGEGISIIINNLSMRHQWPAHNKVVSALFNGFRTVFRILIFRNAISRKVALNIMKERLAEMAKWAQCQYSSSREEKRHIIKAHVICQLSSSKSLNYWAITYICIIFVRAKCASNALRPNERKLSSIEISTCKPQHRAMMSSLTEISISEVMPK